MAGRKWTEEQKEAARQRERARRNRGEEPALPASADETGGNLRTAGEDALPETRATLPAATDAERRKHSRISDAELAAIEAEEDAKADQEAKKRELAEAREEARQRARVRKGLVPASVLRSEAEQKYLNEPVTFRVNLPGGGAGHNGQNGFRVNGRLFQNGLTYTVPRHEFLSLYRGHYLAWLNEVRFRTLDQHKPGNSAEDVVARTIPPFEVVSRA